MASGSYPRAVRSYRRPLKSEVVLGADHVDGSSHSFEEKMAVAAFDVEAVLPHVIFADESVRKARSKRKDGVVCCLVVWVNVGCRGVEERWGLNEGDL